MYTFVRSFYAAPGRLGQLIEGLKSSSALTDKSPSVVVSVGGNISEVSLIWQSETIEDTHAAIDRLASDPRWPAILEKITSAVVPNTSQERIYRHI